MITYFKTLIIHSHKEINEQIKDYLEEKDYICDQIFHIKDLHDNHNRYDCIIVEDNFPKMNIKDFIVQEKIKTHPIIIVLTDTLSSYYLDSLLNIGADDYMTTPYQLKDIDYKIQSIFKNGLLKPRRIYRFKDIIMNVSEHTCICHNKAIDLTKNEFKLLTILISHPYQPFSVSYLFEKIWGHSLYEDEISIPSLLNQLVIKLRIANENEEYIKRFGKNQYKMAF